jgi:hypothetical protein
MSFITFPAEAARAPENEARRIFSQRYSPLEQITPETRMVSNVIRAFNGRII